MMAEYQQPLGQSAPACAPCLPSGTSAYRVMSGETGALPTLLTHWIARSGLIAAGLYVGGLRGKKLVKNALLGGTAIEVFVLAWAAIQVQQDQHRLFGGWTNP